MSAIRNLLRGRLDPKKILLIVCVIMIIIGPIISFVYTYKDVTVTDVTIPTDDGLYLRGTVYTPNKLAGPFPLVISHHGFTCNKEFMNQINVELARAGYCVLAYNSRGHSTSGIDFASYMTWADKEVDDVISAIEFMLNRKTVYNIQPNVSLVGHSHGAFTVAIAANRTYTYQSAEYHVNACVPIAPGYSWDVLIQRTLPGVNYGILQRITRLGNLFTLSEAEKAERSPCTYMKQNYPTNVMIIIGTLDEFFSVEENMRLIANATLGNGDLWTNIQSGVTYNQTGQVYDSLGLRRKIVVEAGIDHIMECFIPQTISETLNFIDTCIYGTPVARSIQIEIMPRLLGVLIGLVGVLFGFYPIASYLTKVWKNRKDYYEYGESARMLGEIKNKQYIKYIIGSCIAAAAGGFSALIFPFPINPYLITDIIGQIGLMTSLFLFIAILVFYKNEKDNFHIESADDIGLKMSGKAWGINAAYGTTLGLGTVAIVSLILLPIFYSFPRNVIGFFLTFIMFLPFVFTLEIISKGFIQNKFASYENKYKEWLYSAIVAGLIQGIAFNVIVLIIGLQANLPWFIKLGGFTDLIPLTFAIPTVIIYVAIGPILFIVINVITGFIFQRTRHVIASTLFLTIVLSWFLSGMTPISFPIT